MTPAERNELKACDVSLSAAAHEVDVAEARVRGILPLVAAKLARGAALIRESRNEIRDALYGAP